MVKTVGGNHVIPILISEYSITVFKASSELQETVPE